MWDYFDGIFCINLPNRPEKWEQSQAEFKKVGLEGKVSRSDGVANEDPKIGCRQAHINVVAHAKEQSLSRVLIFEDDIEFEESDTDAIQAIISQLSQVKDWGLFYFGSIPGSSKSGSIYGNVQSLISENLLRVDGFYGGHAYAVSSLAYDFILENCHAFRDIDNFYARVVSREFPCFHSYPVVCRQKSGYSDINQASIIRNDCSDHIKKQRKMLVEKSNYVTRHTGSIVQSQLYGNDEIRFYIENDDSYSSYENRNLNGEYNHVNFLNLVKDFTPKGGTVIQIGSSYGDEPIFFEKEADVERLIMLEDSDQIVTAIKLNVILNNLSSVDCSYLGMKIDDQKLFQHLSSLSSSISADIISVSCFENNLAVLDKLQSTMIASGARIFVCLLKDQIPAFQRLINTSELSVRESHAHNDCHFFLLEKTAVYKNKNAAPYQQEDYFYNREDQFKYVQLLILHDIERGITLDNIFEKYHVSDNFISSLIDQRTDLSSFRESLLLNFFSSLTTTIALPCANQKLIEGDRVRYVYNTHYCSKWFDNLVVTDNKPKHGLFGSFFKCLTGDFLLHVTVASANLHVGIVKFELLEGQYRIARMEEDDFTHILNRVPEGPSGPINLQPRRWGYHWMSVDCGSVLDVTNIRSFNMLSHFEGTDVYENIVKPLAAIKPV